MKHVAFDDALPAETVIGLQVDDLPVTHKAQPVRSGDLDSLAHGHYFLRY